MAENQNICKQPVVAIVGHIDHGKTTLLDYIRKSSVAAKETGGITQRVSAYEVEHTGAEGTRMMTFIDTPGHEAFQKMRVRAGSAADIAILIVAADDGVKPQTQEAYKAITAAKIPFIVAFTKIDKDTANIEKAKESVMREGIYLEGLGGEIPFVGVSGKTGVGVPELLDLIVLASDVNSITCDSEKPVEAMVIESSRDSKIGISATVIIRQGTIETGGFAVTGKAFAPLRALEDFAGKKVTSIRCGKPARITGFTEEPKVGSLVTTVKTKKEAESAVSDALRNSAIKQGAYADETKFVVRVILKADTAGSLEALEHEVAKITHERVSILTVLTGVGSITESDIKPVIGFSPSLILGFNVKAEGSAKDLAERQHITLETRTIIYELADWLKEKIVELAPPEETKPGVAQIIKHFSTSGSKQVIGGRVTEGILNRDDRVMIMRRGIEVGLGKIVNLQSRKEDVSSVAEGTEFGAQIETKGDIIASDLIVAQKKNINDKR